MKNILLTIRTHLQFNAIELIRVVSDYELMCNDRYSRDYKSLLLGEALSVFMFKLYNKFIPKEWNEKDYINFR